MARISYRPWLFSVEMPERRPELSEVEARVFQAGQHVDGQVALIAGAVRIILGRRKRDVGVGGQRALHIAFRIADQDDDLAAAGARSPQGVVVVAADDRRKASGRGKQAEGAGLTIVAGQHARLGTLFRRQRGTDPLNGFREAVPAKPVAENRRQDLGPALCHGCIATFLHRIQRYVQRQRAAGSA